MSESMPLSFNHKTRICVSPLCRNYVKGDLEFIAGSFELKGGY